MFRQKIFIPIQLSFINSINNRNFKDEFETKRIRGVRFKSSKKQFTPNLVSQIIKKIILETEGLKNNYKFELRT